jgi:hypothetical protein
MIACDVWHLGITQQWASKQVSDLVTYETRKGKDDLAEDLHFVMSRYENDRDLSHSEAVTGKPWREVLSKISKETVRRIPPAAWPRMHKAGWRMVDIAKEAGYSFAYVQKVIARSRIAHNKKD